MKRFIVLISLLMMFLFSAAIAAGPPGVNHEVKLMPGIANQNQMGVDVAINAITLPGQISLNVVIDGTNNYDNMFVLNSVAAKITLIGRAGEGQIVNEFYFPDNMQRRTCMKVAALSPQSEITDYKNFAGTDFTARFGAAVDNQPAVISEVGLVRLWRASDLLI